MSQTTQLVELLLATEDEQKQKEILAVILGTVADAVVRIADSLEEISSCVGSVAGSQSGAVFHHKAY